MENVMLITHQVKSTFHTARYITRIYGTPAHVWLYMYASAS